jgi:hypothetical protein
MKYKETEVMKGKEQWTTRILVQELKYHEFQSSIFVASKDANSWDQNDDKTDDLMRSFGYCIPRVIYTVSYSMTTLL